MTPHLSTNKRFTICYFQRDPPEEVLDLFADFQDGRILMALLEELSGCKLVGVKLWSGSRRRRKNIIQHNYFTVVQFTVNLTLKNIADKTVICVFCQLYRFRSSSQRIFRLNNISKALAFLDDRHVSMFVQ